MGSVFLQSVPEIAKRLSLDRSGRQARSDKTRTITSGGRCDSAHGTAPPRILGSLIASSGESTVSSGTDDEDPLEDLERAAALESCSSKQHSSSPPENPPTAASPGDLPSTSHVPEDRHVAPPRTPALRTEQSPALESNPEPDVIRSVKTCSGQSTCSTSSEEWTGDEEFLPLSVRQRHRARRLAYRQALRSPQQASRFSAQTRAGLDWETVRRLQQSSSYENSPKASRFRTKGSVGGVRRSGAMQEPKESQTDDYFDEEGINMT